MESKKQKKIIVGLIEEITIMGKHPVKTLALFDTGANISSVDTRLASKARLGPIVKTQRVKNPSFKQQTTRPVVNAKVKIKNHVFETEVNIQDRSHMTFPVIIGRNVSVGNFIIDPAKNLALFKEMQHINNEHRMQGQRKLKHFIDR
jgi:hypothetical protein